MNNIPSKPLRYSRLVQLKHVDLRNRCCKKTEKNLQTSMEEIDRKRSLAMKWASNRIKRHAVFVSAIT